ncbi:ikaros family zinc finger protein-like isoform X2 [Dunckerocampus dactyliophorus]|uniref:ikaros family zinc finger protein-like isoform X2 n=1 Tax=Dunckerocampus dactyliophorus TaxID=161453 RepID=UPI002404F026|nr:ikaros family zinc finger protein-like isoform X2 [Dunckerocampus dactyliophorus]
MLHLFLLDRKWWKVESSTPTSTGALRTAGADAKPLEEKDNSSSFAENVLQCVKGVIKVESEETENDTYPEAEKERAIFPKEERDGAVEEGMEEGYDGDRTEDDDENDEEKDYMNEPEDLSLVDYSGYNSAAVQDASAMSPHLQSPGKLSCDICGLSCVSINVLLVHKRSHTGERPFHCTQCGASFTQKGNLLRHIKLHSGEKPFKCPMCSYACRRRDALSGHLRTHSVEKPFKCNLCSRSYKQRSSLEEHRERCHVYVHSSAAPDNDDSQPPNTQMGSKRALLLDRIASNVAKRKSSMPQKFTGDNGVCLDLSFNKEHAEDLPFSSPAPEAHRQQPSMHSGPDGGPGHPQRPYPALLSRNDISPMSLTNGHRMIMQLPGLPHTPQPPLGMDAFHPDGPQISQPITYSLGHLLGGLNHHNGVSPTQPIFFSCQEALQELRSDGKGGASPGAVYPCSHCKVIFLDYVMFTIHMGCHGFRDPLECNVCGHRSRDRYEFSSHIVRGEHRLDVK